MTSEIADLLLTIEVALSDCDGEELANGDVLDFPEAYKALKRLRSLFAQTSPVVGGE